MTYFNNLMMALTFVGLLASGAQAQESHRTISVIQQSIIQAKPPLSDMKVVVWADDKDASYHPGQLIKVFARANQDAYITVINVNAEGVATQLFPNVYEQNNFVKANQALEVCKSPQCALQVSGPAGTDVIKVIASTDDKALVPSNNLQQSGSFYNVVGGANTVLKSIRTISVVPTPVGTTAQVQTVSQTAAASMRITVEDHQAQAVQAPGVNTTNIVETNPNGDTIVTQITTVSGANGVQGPPVANATALKTDFGLQLSPSKGSYAVGDMLRVTATAEEDCLLSVYLVNPTGNYNVLFKGVALEEGKAQFLPQKSSDLAIQLGAPLGEHTLVGICTEEKRGFLSSLFGSKKKDDAQTRNAHTIEAEYPTIQSVITASLKNEDATARSSSKFTVQ